MERSELEDTYIVVATERNGEVIYVCSCVHASLGRALTSGGRVRKWQIPQALEGGVWQDLL